ncbi:MAG: hypothetical protein K6U11_02610 [bacterium]|nr:hypothetical protein [bacterium]
MDSIPEPLIEEYFKQKIERILFPSKFLTTTCQDVAKSAPLLLQLKINKWPEPAFSQDGRGQGIAKSSNGFNG